MRPKYWEEMREKTRVLLLRSIYLYSRRMLYEFGLYTTFIRV